ncbi:MAG: hypothetical protein K2H83_02995 [Duncaniella sp.]|nr:hypothetical protein [Duncaniella sp.]MDE5734091.1 hypothetical protein [Duncaniella sp.]MDE6177950.1 hypothetical protein [Duncaniella sp.]MDE6390460.1 hypothetical protein [Duncaniella sp.]
MKETKEQLGSLWAELRDTLRLNIEYAKLTGAEKLTTLLGMATLGLLIIIICSIVLFMISFGLTILLAKSTGMFGACMIMAGIYMVLVVLLFFLRKQLVFDPIARFISTLILK